MAVQSKCTFIDPSNYPSATVYELLEAAARGHAGIDQRFIHAIVDRGDAAVADLVRFALEDRGADPVNLEEDLIAVFRYLRSPEALDFYVRWIRENPEDVPDEIIDGVVPIGERAVAPLLSLYEELGEEQGGDVAFLLAALGVRDERILKILVERLEYDAGDAALTLSVYRDPAAKPALEAMLAQIPANEDTLRREFTMAIDACNQESPHAAEVEPVSFDIWDLYPEESAPPVEVLSEAELLEMLGCASAAYRAEAARSFRNRADYSPEVRDRLLELTRTDADASVRAGAWEALGEKANEPGVRSALHKAVADETLDLAERTGALVGLAGISDDPKVARQMRAFYDRPETRAKAMEAMWRSFDPQFAGVFPKHLHDADADCRRAAIWGAGYLGKPALAGEIREMFDDQDFRADALFAYALLVPSEITHARVPGLFRKINETAGGLSYGEAELVQTALDQRLTMHGLDPYFANADPEAGDWDADAEPEPEPEPKPGPAKPAAASPTKPGRNDPCPCGSGKKYKKCHGT